MGSAKVSYDPEVRKRLRVAADCLVLSLAFVSWNCHLGGGFGLCSAVERSAGHRGGAPALPLRPRSTHVTGCLWIWELEGLQTPSLLPRGRILRGALSQSQGLRGKIRWVGFCCLFFSVRD